MEDDIRLISHKSEYKNIFAVLFRYPSLIDKRYFLILKIYIIKKLFLLHILQFDGINQLNCRRSLLLLDSKWQTAIWTDDHCYDWEIKTISTNRNWIVCCFFLHKFPNFYEIIRIAIYAMVKKKSSWNANLT